MANLPWLSATAAAHPDRVALATGAGRETFAELLAAVRAVELPPGAGPVPIALPPGRDFVLALHACLERGRPAVPLDSRLAPRDGPRGSRPAPARRPR